MSSKTEASFGTIVDTRSFQDTEDTSWRALFFGSKKYLQLFENGFCVETRRGKSFVRYDEISSFELTVTKLGMTGDGALTTVTGLLVEFEIQTRNSSEKQTFGFYQNAGIKAGLLGKPLELPPILDSLASNCQNAAKRQSGGSELSTTSDSSNPEVPVDALVKADGTQSP